MSSRVMAPHVQRPAPPKTYNMQGQPENRMSAERSERTGLYTLINELYWGAEPCTPWKTESNILNLIRCSMGNQCNDFKIGVIWVYFLVRVTIRAAAFCSLWILASLVWGKLYRSALPKSKRDEINAWTIFSAADRVKYLRMKPRFRSWYHTELHMLDIWEDMVIVESSITPKLRQESETPMTVSGITIEVIVYFA